MGLIFCFLCVGFSGRKFSVEEERVVIELQGQFGNKWAKIASYLTGRTDNDVKNFWSSRQKRIARILNASPPSSPKSKSKTKSKSKCKSKCNSNRNKNKVPSSHNVSHLEVINSFTLI